jgi:hypothetical protein
MDYAKEVDIGDNDNELAIGNDSNNESLLLRATTMTTTRMPTLLAALRASHSQQHQLRV